MSLTPPKGNDDSEHRFTAALNKMKQQTADILGGAFEELFTKRSKHFFSDMLQGFEQMLEQMAAKALAMGIVNLLTGGAGGFIGGALSGLGFDDPGNDRQAQHWGFDFANHFQKGIAEHNRSMLAPAGTGAGGGTTNSVQIHMGEVHMHNMADVHEIGRTLAWHVQTGLSQRTGH